jgi:hypothetical protein
MAFARTGRPAPQTHHQLRLAQTDSKSLARNHPLASPLLSAGRRDAAVWTVDEPTSVRKFRVAPRASYAPLDRLLARFRAGRGGWPKTSPSELNALTVASKRSASCFFLRPKLAFWCPFRRLMPGGLWLDWARSRFRFLRPSSFNTALQLVLRPHFLVNFV